MVKQIPLTRSSGLALPVAFHHLKLARGDEILTYTPSFLLKLKFTLDRFLLVRIRCTGNLDLIKCRPF